VCASSHQRSGTDVLRTWPPRSDTGNVRPPASSVLIARATSPRRQRSQQSRTPARRLTAGRDMLWSPTIRAALIAGTPWLEVFCRAAARAGRSICAPMDRHPPASRAAVVVGCYRATLCPRGVARFLHTRRSAMTFMVAARTSAQRAAFDTVSIAPSISRPWTTLPTTITTARSVWAMRHVRGRQRPRGHAVGADRWRGADQSRSARIWCTLCAWRSAVAHHQRPRRSFAR
jgi:hypothetical protein